MDIVGGNDYISPMSKLLGEPLRELEIPVGKIFGETTDRDKNDTVSGKLLPRGGLDTS
jgi:hypothetical protein